MSITTPRTDTALRAAAPEPGRTPSRRRRRTGTVVSVLAGAFLAFDAALHIANPQVVRDATAALGFEPGVAVLMGLVELVCLALYAVPRTAVLGAVLLTGYLGGAVTAQLRIEAPLFSTLLFPVYLGVAVWAGLWLRDPRVRQAVAPARD